MQASMQWATTLPYFLESLISIVCYVLGLVIAISSRSSQGRWSLLASFSIMALSTLVSVVAYALLLQGGSNEPYIKMWMILNGITRILSIISVILLILGIKGVLDRNRFLENLHEEVQDDLDR